MKLIIEIDREDYEKVKNHKGSYSFGNAIYNGIPLPKGHGRLIDADELANDDRVCNGISCSECPFENFREHSCRWCDFIKNYHAIIEADKESEE